MNGADHDTIYSAITWTSIELPGDPTAGSLRLVQGTVGHGSPNATLVAGVHGDEGPWGAMAIRKVLEHPREALRGSLRILLAANPAAVAADRRNAPFDHLDLNQSFPGDDGGSHTERLASALALFVGDTDLLIDLHGGGSWCVNAFVFRFAGSEGLADAVGAPFVVDIQARGANLAGHAATGGARIVAIEMGGRSGRELAWRDRLAASLDRILALDGVLEVETSPASPSRRVVDLTVLRPSRGGILIPSVRDDVVGTLVARDTPLGVVHDLHTLEPLEELRAPFDPTALLLLRPHVAVVEGGAMAYVVAVPAD